MPKWWDGIEGFVTPSGEYKDPPYGACWPIAVTEIVAKWGKIPADDLVKVADEVRKGYIAYADFDYGADSRLVPGYVERYGLYGQRLDVSGWESERQWQFLRCSTNMDWPVIDGVKLPARAYGHAIVIRQCLIEDGVKKILVNDPSGDYYRTGKWDQNVTGEGLVWNFKEFVHRTFVIIVPLDAAQALDAFIAEQ